MPCVIEIRSIEQSRAEQRLTAPFLRLTAAGRLKLHITFVMDNRRT